MSHSVAHECLKRAPRDCLVIGVGVTAGFGVGFAAPFGFGVAAGFAAPFGLATVAFGLGNSTFNNCWAVIVNTS